MCKGLLSHIGRILSYESVFLSVSFKVLFVYVFQHLHLLNGYPVETDKPLVLREPIVDEHGIQVLHVRETNQFVDGCIVADVAFQVWVCITPFEGGDAEHGYVQHIAFAGIDSRGLLGCYFDWDEILLDSVGMDSVVYLRQLSFSAPANLRLLLLLE